MPSVIGRSISQAGSSAGPLLLGHLFNWGLFGTLTVQTYIYYMAFPKDPLISKIIVHSIYIIEFIQTLLATHDAWDALGGGWGVPNALIDPHWLWFSVPVLSGIISCSVQLYFGYRIFKLSNKIAIGVFVAILALAEGSAAIASGAQAFMLNDLTKLQSNALIAFTVWLAGSAICDVFITSCMFFLMSRSKSGFKTSEAFVTRFIRLFVETGLVTAIFAIINLIIFLSLRKQDYHIVPALALSKLYSNCLLVLYNSRVRIINGRDYGHEVNWQMWASEKAAALEGSAGGPRSMDIHFKTVTRTVDALSSFGGINVEVRRDVIRDDFPMTGLTSKFSRDDDQTEHDPFHAKAGFQPETSTM